MTWRIGRIEQKSTRTLDAWMVMEVPFDGADRPWTRHLVGWRLEGGKGQVSSPVEVFDPATRRAVTRSGRVYELGERSGVNGDAFATWSRWKALNAIADDRDVTSEAIAALSRDT